MKKIIGLVVLVFVFISILILAFASAVSSDRDYVITGKIGLILNNSSSDLSWNQTHYEGVLSASKKLNCEMMLEENVIEKDCEAVVERFINSGCKIIVANSFEFGPVLSKMADKYPNVCFFHATGLETKRNLTSYFGRIYQMRFLSGIVAGLQTKSDRIGYVAAYPISEVNRGINAFTLGVLAVNPKAKVCVIFSNSWYDDISTENATHKLLSQVPEIDVLAMHTDSQRVLQIAEQKKIWSIGYNRDNSNLYPETFLTAPVWNWEAFYYPQFESVYMGKFKGAHYWCDEETGIIGLGKMSEKIPLKNKVCMLDYWQRFQNGLFDVFYGEIYDNKGVLRVSKGESMPDEVLLNNFDWYVMGVELHE